MATPYTCTNERTLMADPNTCPYCKCVDLRVGEVDIQSESMYRPVICRGCAAEWTETYTLTGVTI